MQQADQPQPLQLSLGNALLGALVADGFKEAEEELPAPWQADFEDENLANADFCQRLALSCTAGCRYAQQRAPRFTASLDITNDAQRFGEDQLRTSVVITQRKDQGLLTTILLRADTLPIPYYPEEAYKQALAQRRAALKKGRSFYRLSSAYQAVAQLALSASIHVQDPALPLFLPRFSGVTQLRIDDTLAEDWLGLFLDHLPKLAVLTAHGVCDMVRPNGDMAKRECQYTRLVLTETHHEPERMHALAATPLPTNKRKLHVEFSQGTELLAFVIADMGLEEHARLGRWVLSGVEHVLLVPHEDNRHELGLPTALNQLKQLDVSNRTLELFGWYIDANFIGNIARVTDWEVGVEGPTGWHLAPQALVDRQLPCLTSLSLSNHKVLTDELLTAVLVHCRGLRELCVHKLALEHSHAHWCAEGWVTVYVVVGDTADMEQLERLPGALQGPYRVVSTRVEAPRNSRGALLYHKVVKTPYECIIYPSLTLDSDKVPESVSFHPPPITKSSKAYKSLYEDEIDTDTPILASALLRLTTPTTLPAADQAAALQSALDRAAAADSVSTCLYLHLTDFTLGPELERVLAGAKASGRDVRVSMVGGRCSRRGLALAAPLPPFTRLELVGMCGEDTAATHTDTAALGWLGEAAAGQWVVSVRQLLRLLHCCGGADTVTLQDCELVFSFDGSEECFLKERTLDVSTGQWTMQPCFFKTLVKTCHVKHTVPSLTTYHIRPASPDMDVVQQALAIQASHRALNPFATPDVLQYTGDWHMSIVAGNTFTPMPACRRVVVGADAVWPVEGTGEAAWVCQRLGQMLLSQPHTELVVHDTCGVSNLAHVLLGGRLGVPGPVYVVTADTGFKHAMQIEMRLRLGTGTPVQHAIQPCSQPPALAPKPPTPEQQAAENTAQIDKYKRAQWEGERVAAGLRGEADIVEKAERDLDAARLRDRASEVASMAAQAEETWQAMEGGEAHEPVPGIDCGLAHRVWSEFVCEQERDVQQE